MLSLWPQPVTLAYLSRVTVYVQSRCHVTAAARWHGRATGGEERQRSGDPVLPSKQPWGLRKPPGLFNSGLLIWT